MTKIEWLRSIYDQNASGHYSSSMAVETTDSGVLGLPAKFKAWRPAQSEIMSKVVQAFLTGRRFVEAELPTGSGKTLIAMGAKQLMESRTAYVCTTKSLQDQFLADFPDALLIKGRNNYQCGVKNVTADLCPAKKCAQDCPYILAKSAAIRAPLTVMNMSYFLSEIQHVGAFRGRDYVVVDECDTLEDALLDQVSVQIFVKDVQRLRLGSPARITKFEEWKVWAGESLSLVNKELAIVERELEELQDRGDWSTVPTELVRERNFLQRVGGKFGFFLKYVDEHWVWERLEDRWAFKPVRVDQFGDMIFSAGDKFLLMSATILDFNQYERNVGLSKYREDGLVSAFRMGSSFGVERRPIIIKKGVDLTYKNRAAGMAVLPSQVKEILDAHPNEKGVIHTVTYDIAKAIQQAFPKRVRIHTSFTRAAVIDEFKRTTLPLVLVSPSIDRGEDFPDEVCRFIIVVKMPYPYLGDPRIAKRLHSMKDGQRWYTLKTVSKLIQMTGRGMRHADDRCTSYILDKGFKRLYLENKSLFPTWWTESLVWEGR